MGRYTINNIPMPIDFECNSDNTLRTLQNCKNLIMCRMGEVPYDRMRGINPAIFDMSIEDAEEELLPEIDRVLGWEPDADAISATIEINSMGDTVITVEVDVTE